MTTYLSAYWKLHINGKEIPQERRDCIQSLEIHENCSGSDTLTFKVSDPEMLFIEDNIYIEDTPISAEVGWNEANYLETFDGYIAAVDIDFPDSGMPTLTITCMDESYKMDRKKHSNSWDDTTSAEVVKKIASKYGLSCVVEPNYSFKKQDTITQSNQTDIAFVESLASEEKDPFLAKLVGRTLYYTKMGILAEPKAQLGYKVYPYEVISFSPQITREDIPEEVSSSDVTSDTKEEDTFTSDVPSTVSDYLNSSASDSVISGSNSTKDSGANSSTTPSSSSKTVSSGSPVSTSDKTTAKMKFDPNTRKWVLA